MTDYTTFEAQLLVGCYLVSEDTGEEIVPVIEVFRQYGFHPRPNWIDRALAGFVQSGLAADMRTLAMGLQQEVWLNAEGVKRAERLLRNGVRPPPGPSKFLLDDETLKSTSESSNILSEGNEREQDIPAADRLVPIDHNREVVKSAINGARALAVQLETSNDVGNLTAEEVGVASAEVEAIASDLERPFVRMPAFGERAKSTLSWIGQQAAGAVVGAAALALLALIATFLGFTL